MLVLRLRRGVCMKAYMYERYPQAIVLSDTSNRCSPQRHRAFEKMALWLFKNAFIAAGAVHGNCTKLNSRFSCAGSVHARYEIN